jgi:hypothetical protein
MKHSLKYTTPLDHLKLSRTIDNRDERNHDVPVMAFQIQPQGELLAEGTNPVPHAVLGVVTGTQPASARSPEPHSRTSTREQSVFQPTRDKQATLCWEPPHAPP